MCTFLSYTQEILYRDQNNRINKLNKKKLRRKMGN